MLPPFTPTGIDHLVIWVRGLEKARLWYQTVLGCRPGYEYPDIAMTHVWHGPVLIGLWDADDERSAYAKFSETGENVHHISFGWQGASEQDVRDHLSACHVEIEKEVRQIGARGFGLSLYFRDPWNNLIELKGPPIAELTWFQQEPQPKV